MTDTPTTHVPAWDDDDRRLAEDLDRLARAEADSAPPGLEARLAHTSTPALRAGRSPVIGVLFSRPVRAAAAVAILALGVALVILTRAPASHRPGSPTVGSDAGADIDTAVEEWLSLAALGEQDSIAAELDVLYAETARLGEAVDRPFEPGLEEGQGSM